MRASKGGQSSLLLLDVIETLDREKTDYAVIGALATSIHGALRGTADADALVSVPFTRLTKLRARFDSAGFDTKIRKGGVDDPIPALMVIVDEYGNRVDLLDGLRGLDLNVFKRTVEVPFADGKLRVVGREDLIAMKCFAGGPIDLADARAVLTSAPNRVDLDLIRRLTRRFGRAAADALEEVLAR